MSHLRSACGETGDGAIRLLIRRATITPRGMFRDDFREGSEMTIAKKDRNLAILARRKEGGMLQEIADEFGLNVNTIMKICRAGEPYGFGTRPVPVERVAVKDQDRTKEIIALRRARKSLKAIGEVLGISRQRVWVILKKAGEPTDLPPWTPPNGKPAVRRN